MSAKRWTAVLFAGALVMAACGDDGGGGAMDGPDASESSEPGGEPAGDPVSGGGGGTLVLGDETITLDQSLCHLEEQEAAAGGGTIELTAQGQGTDAAGEEVSVDFTRFSTESQFEGDDVSVVIGDFTAGIGTELTASLETGTVERDGNTLGATDIALMDLDDGSETTASFQIDC